MIEFNMIKFEMIEFKMIKFKMIELEMTVNLAKQLKIKLCNCARDLKYSKNQTFQTFAFTSCVKNTILILLYNINEKLA